MTGAPCLDDKVVSGHSDSRDHDFANVYEESVRAGRTVPLVDFERGPGDLGVTEPEGWVLVGVDGGAV